MSQNKRVEYIDIYRGLAILLMVMGHVDFGRDFDHYIHAFHMPMWFFVSGYFFKDKGYKIGEFIKIKAKKLLVPYAVFGIFHYILAVRFIDSSRGILHKEYIRNYLFTNYDGLPITGVFWFLTCLIIADFIFLYVKRYVKSEMWFGISIFALSIFGVLYSKYSPVRMFWTADTSFVVLIFYYFGYVVKNNQFIFRCYSKFLEKGTLVCAALFGINALLIFKTSYINLRTGTYSHPIPFYYNAFMAILLYLNFSYFIDKFRIAILGPIKRWLCYVGENTMIYLLLNQLMIQILRKSIPCGSIVEKILLLVICMLILTIISKLFENRYLKWMIGK